MTQVIGNVMIIELTPQDKAKTVLEVLFARYDAQLGENALLQLELERIKEQQRQMSFALPG